MSMWRARVCGGAGVVCTVLAAACPPGASAGVVKFVKAGCQTWNVPANAGDIEVLATGAAGAEELGGAAGTGDGVTATLVPPLYGPGLDVCVDYGGGGSFYGGDGGGASGVSPAVGFGHAQVVAGGGGGGGFLSTGGGSAGLPAGSAGPGTTGPFGGAGGAGGDNNAATCGGAGGSGSLPGGDGAGITPAGPGVGGTGGGVPAAGGGGGGGYCGGGGGGAPVVHGASGGGGGGSDWCGDPLRVSGCSVLSGLGTLTGAGPYTGEASVMLAYGGSQLPHPTVTSVTCAGARLAVCTVTVTDRWPTPTTPTGVVRFSAMPATLFVAPFCSLVRAKSPGTATCDTDVLQSKSGNAVTGTYPGDRTHQPSFGTYVTQG